ASLQSDRGSLPKDLVECSQKACRLYARRNHDARAETYLNPSIGAKEPPHTFAMWQGASDQCPRNISGRTSSIERGDMPSSTNPDAPGDATVSISISST